MEIAVKLKVIDILHGIRQFGLRNSVVWSKHLIKLSKRMSRVSIFPPSVIAEGIDIDNDGIYEGFKLHLRRAIHSEATIINFEVIVNNEKINKEFITISTDNKKIKASKISRRNPLILLPGDSMEVEVLTKKKLKKKRVHVLFRMQVPMVSSPAGILLTVKIK